MLTATRLWRGLFGGDWVGSGRLATHNEASPEGHSFNLTDARQRVPTTQIRRQKVGTRCSASTSLNYIYVFSSPSGHENGLLSALDAAVSSAVFLAAIA